MLHNNSKKNTLIAVDLLPLDPVVTNELQRAPFESHVLRGDLRSEVIRESLERILRKAPVSLVLSDMAANTTGDKQTDAFRTMVLCEAALELAIDYRSTCFVGKFFSCQDEIALRARAQECFAKVSVMKPPASRKTSSERYLLAQGFRKT